jgi:D-apionolactonase
VTDNVLSRNEILYGRDEPLAERRELRAGDLTCIYEGGDLRYVSYRGHEIVRRVYAAVRDHNWGTLDNEISGLRMDVKEDSFHIAYSVMNRRADINFRWDATITGSSEGRITFVMDGRARSTFRRNRIGFCVLHPMGCASLSCQVEHTNGAVEEGFFPELISPHQPFFDIQAITYQPVSGVEAAVGFLGEVFEMEDQRNWTDASYKTYCTPLGLSFPATVRRGERVRQSVTISAHGESSEPIAAPEGLERETSIAFGSGSGAMLPGLGLGVSTLFDHEMTKGEAALLSALAPSHLLVELDLAGGWEPKLAQALRSAKALGVAIEVLAVASGDYAAQLGALADVARGIKVSVCAWHVVDREAMGTPVELAEAARAALSGLGPVGGGTNSQFTELNRYRPPTDSIDVVCYPLNPQMHAFDNASLVETLEAQGATVDSARVLAGELPLSVGPVTLKFRFNPVAMGPTMEPEEAVLPEQVDERQMSLFGAVWTVGSLANLVGHSGVERLTYYETVGWRGVMEAEEGSPSALFPSLPGGVYPLYHVFAALADVAGGEVLERESSHPLRAEGLAVRGRSGSGGSMIALVANLTPDEQRVVVKGLSGSGTLHMLDERSAEAAMRDPATLWEAGHSMTFDAGGAALELLPYAVAMIDLEASS